MPLPLKLVPHLAASVLSVVGVTTLSVIPGTCILTAHSPDGAAPIPPILVLLILSIPPRIDLGTILGLVLLILPMPREAFIRHASAMGLIFNNPRNVCHACSSSFFSRNALYRHLRGETHYCATSVPSIAMLAADLFDA